MEIVGDAALQHLHHIRSPGDVDPEISRVRFMDDFLQAGHESFRFPAPHKKNDVARLAIFRDEQSTPKWTFHRILEILGTVAQTFDRGHVIQRFDFPAEFLDALQISWGRDIAGRNCQHQLRLGRETFVDLVRLRETRITGGKEKILFHHWLKIDKYRHQDEQRDRHRQHLPMRAWPDGLVPNCREELQIISTGHFGSACMNARPYGLVTMRLSRITMMPLSLFVRIRRPTPCRSFRIASGNEYSVKASPP